MGAVRWVVGIDRVVGRMAGSACARALARFHSRTTAADLRRPPVHATPPCPPRSQCPSRARWCTPRCLAGWTRRCHGSCQAAAMAAAARRPGARGSPPTCSASGEAAAPNSCPGLQSRSGHRPRARSPSRPLPRCPCRDVVALLAGAPEPAGLALAAEMYGPSMGAPRAAALGKPCCSRRACCSHCSGAAGSIGLRRGRKVTCVRRLPPTSLPAVAAAS